MFKFPAIKTQLIAFLVFFAALLSILDRDAAFLFGLLIAAISAIAADLALMYFRKQKPRFDDSSVISGVIIGFVLSNNQPWWFFSLASLFAIASKHLLRFNNRHIFNPAGLGIFLVVLFFRGFSQWQGGSIWYIVAPFGIYFVYKIRKLEIIVSYVLAYLALFGLNAFGYFNYFFACIMLIEPKTTPVTRRGKIIFGVGVAGMLFLLTKLNFRYEAEIFSLLTMNLLVHSLKIR